MTTCAEPGRAADKGADLLKQANLQVTPAGKADEGMPGSAAAPEARGAPLQEQENLQVTPPAGRLGAQRSGRRCSFLEQMASCHLVAGENSVTQRHPGGLGT